MNIVIFLGGFTYNSANEFSYKIGEFFESNGVSVIYVDLNAENLTEQINNAFSKPIAFVLGFNGIGCSLKYENENLFNYLQIPYVYYLLDHPSHHIARLSEEIQKKIIICLDNSHADYIDQHDGIQGITTFIPTAGYSLDFEFDATQKKYDVVFTGYIKSKQELWEILPNDLTFIREYLDVLITQKRDIYIDREMQDFVNGNPILKDIVQRKVVSLDAIIVQADFYIRGKKRYEIIKYLLEQHVKIDFYGTISDSHEFLSYPNFVHHGVVEYNELIDVYKKAKITLNPMPNFPEGGHDRVFMSMMAGSIPLTDNNVYFEQNLPNSVLKFNYLHMEQMLPLIQNVLHCDETLRKMCVENYEFATQHHTWANRMEALIYVVNQANEYWNA